MASPPRLRAPGGLSERVPRQALLVLFKLVPRDVGLVVIPHERGPRFHRAPAGGLAHGALDDHRVGLRLAIGVRARIEGILQSRDDGAIHGRAPPHGGRVLAVQRARDGQGLAAHVQQDLPGAAQAIEQPEDGAQRLLDPPVGIEHQAQVGRPDVTDRDGHPQLASTRLSLGGLEHALAQQRELELAHRALEPQQQAVVRHPGIVGAVGVDDVRAHQPAELEEMMPVAPVAREARSFEAEHRADQPFADLPDETPKARALHRATGRPPQVVVDDHDVLKAVPAGHVHQLVLAALTLAIVLNLPARRLPHIDDGAAAEHGRREVTGRHRRSPASAARLPVGAGRAGR